MTTLKSIASACVFALLAVLPAQSQTAQLPYGPPITLEAAKKVMAAAEGEAAKNNWPMVIAIIDSGGHLVMLHRMDNSQLSSVELSQGKARSSLYFKIPSKLLDEAISGGGAGLRFLALRDIVPLDGGLPIVADGKIVGAIGVSGMRSANNAQVAQAGAEALK
jgi:glc operon protein GlcG